MDLARNPFFLLGASLRDDRRRILDLAEEKSLLTSADGVQEAAATLTNPRKRLAAELAWLPGLAPKRIDHALAILEADPARLRDEVTLPTLARANLLADGLGRAIEAIELDIAAAWIVELANAYDELDPEAVTALLNEERSVASFPLVSDTRQIEAELQSRRLHYRRAMRDALDRLPPIALVRVVTRAVELATQEGATHAPILVDDLVDAYEVEAQAFLETEHANIALLIGQLRNAAAAKALADLDRLVEKLSKVVRNWDSVAQPIQMSARSRGRDHDMSIEVAGEIRSLAVDLTNEHGLLEASKKLTALQQEVFAEIDRVVEISDEDSLALDQLADQRAQLADEITYEAEIGAVFKEKLRISPDGVDWKGVRYPLDAINRVRWGGTKHSINGIPTGTTYTIYIGTDAGDTNITLKRQQIFAEFIDRLWRAVGVRLLGEMLSGLREGKHYRFGSAVVSDQGVELARSHYFSSDERVSCKWTDLVIGNGAGTFYIAKKDEKKVSADLSYLGTNNVHVLEAAMRVFWKSASERLSDLLGRTG